MPAILWFKYHLALIKACPGMPRHAKALRFLEVLPVFFYKFCTSVLCFALRLSLISTIVSESLELE